MRAGARPRLHKQIFKFILFILYFISEPSYKMPRNTYSTTTTYLHCQIHLKKLSARFFYFKFTALFDQDGLQQSAKPIVNKE